MTSAGTVAPGSTPGPAPPPPFGTRRTFAALRHRNYRLWFSGQIVSLFGTWMQATAQGFLMFELTRSAAYLGYVGFAAGVPTWLLMLYGGVVSDRVHRRNVLLLTQATMMVLAFVLAGLTFAGLVRPWHILALAFGLGVANAFDAPARQSFVAELVERRDLTNAIALNATMFNTATAVGPAVAGVTYDLFGPGWCFALNGLSFVAVIAALAAMRFGEHLPPRRRPARADLTEALRYVLASRETVTLIALVGALGSIGNGLITLVPVWAVNILHGDATTNGLLQSGRGVGALAAALTIASLGHVDYKGRLLTAGTFALPVSLAVFAVVRGLSPALLLVAAVGASVILVVNLANALVQTLVPDALRGRVMGIYTLVFFGLLPLAALALGTLAQHVGAPNAVLLAAAVALAFASAVFVFAPTIRRLA